MKLNRFLALHFFKKKQKKTTYKSVQRDFQCDFARMTGEADGSVVVVLLFFVHDKQLWSCRDSQLT